MVSYKQRLETKEKIIYDYFPENDLENAGEIIVNLADEITNCKK